MKKILSLVILSVTVFSSCKKDKAAPAISAAFTVSKSNYYLNEQLVLSNTSTNAASFTWDFGDTQSSTEQNPKHTYAKAGTYSIKLTTNGNSSAVKTIKVYPGTASYEVDNNSSYATPLVSFNVDADNNIFDFTDHGTIGLNAKSDTVYTNNTTITIGGKIGDKIFFVITPYPIVKYTHNKLVLLNTTQVRVTNGVANKPGIQDILGKRLNKQAFKSIQ